MSLQPEDYQYFLVKTSRADEPGEKQETLTGQEVADRYLFLAGIIWDLTPDDYFTMQFTMNEDQVSLYYTPCH